MPRHLFTVPTYRCYKSSGRAFTVVGGRFVYLGPYDSSASREMDARVVRETAVAGPAAALALAAPMAGPVTVAEVLAAFLEHAQKTYAPRADAAGRPLANETHNYHAAVKPVAKLYASVAATDFGPKALKAVRDEMVAGGLSLKMVNRQVQRVKRIFRWAVEEEMIPGKVAYRLNAVAAIRAGQGSATVRPKVKPADSADVDATLRRVPRRVGDMIRLQLLTGMRSGNVCGMRVGDLNMTDPQVWVYTPGRHKTQHHGHELKISIGPRAQAIIRPYLRCDPGAFIFSPAQGEAERRAIATAARVTPLSCGNRAGRGKPNRCRRPADCYTTGSYCRAVHRAITTANAEAAAAGLPPAIGPWHPHQLRHNRATEIRAALGNDAVLAALGVRTLKIAELYAEVDATKAARVAREIG